MLRSCDVLTEGVLQAGLRGQLTAEERAILLRHLREPCEACLDLLEGWTAEEMISLKGPDDLLSRRERERLFAAVSARSPSGPAGLRIVPPQRRRLPRVVWGTAAAALALFALVTVVRPGRRDAEDGFKGVQKPTVALFPLVGTRTPMPHVVRALPPGGPFARGELLLLRIRLDTPAWIYLLSQKQGEPSELLWPLEAGTRHRAGEFELAESGTALAIDPEALGTGAQLLLIASPERIDARRLRVPEPLRTRAEVESAFPGCGVDLLPVIIEPDR